MSGPVEQRMTPRRIRHGQHTMRDMPLAWDRGAGRTITVDAWVSALVRGMFARLLNFR